MSVVLDRRDGKCLGGLTVFPYENGISLVWDATRIECLALFAINKSVTKSGIASAAAETNSCTQSVNQSKFIQHSNKQQ